MQKLSAELSDRCGSSPTAFDIENRFTRLVSLLDAGKKEVVARYLKVLERNLPALNDDQKALLAFYSERSSSHGQTNLQGIYARNGPVGDTYQLSISTNEKAA